MYIRMLYPGRFILVEPVWPKSQFLKKRVNNWPLFAPKMSKKLNEWGYEILKRVCSKMVGILENSRPSNMKLLQFYLLLWIHIIDCLWLVNSRKSMKSNFPDRKSNRIYKKAKAQRPYIELCKLKTLRETFQAWRRPSKL